MVKSINFLIFLCCITGSSAFSQDDPDKWFKSLKKSSFTKSVFPMGVVFVKSLPKKGEVEYEPNIDVAGFNKLGFIQFSNWLNADWNYKLNKKKFARRPASKLIYKFSKANTIIETDEGWRINHISNRKPLAKMSKPDDMSPKTLSDWFVKGMGWDGVVLAQRGETVLVGSTKSILSQPEIQALAIDESASKFIVPQKERKGSGLLSLQKISGGLGIFDIVFLGKGKKNIPIGTKLIIERKKK
jgi:hypothetical protein